MSTLSQRQQKILAFVDDFLDRRGYPPTVRDIQAGCAVSSTSVVDYNLKALEKMGLLHRRREISRGLEIPGRAGGRGLVPVPLLGTIAAGSPIPVPETDAWGPTDNLRKQR